MVGMSSLNKTIRKSVFSGLICGVGALVGGVIGGPIGIGVGSVVGGVIISRFFRFRSALTVLREEFSDNEQCELLDRGVRTLINWKERLIRVILEVLEALFKCQSKKEFIEMVLMPLLREFTHVALQALLRYLSAV